MAQNHTERAGRAAQQAVAQAARQPWIKPLARLGYAAIGVVYALIGVLAVRLALGFGGEAPDKDTALREILQAPFGRVLLGLVAVGLIGYLVWRVVEAVLDVENKGDDAKGMVLRIGYFVSGLIAGALGLQAGRMALGMGGGNSDDTQRDWTARLLSQPFGPWLVGIVGLIVVGVGVFQIYRAWKESYRDNLAWNQMSSGERTLADRAAKIGLVAHGIVLGLIGWFVIQAAITFNPDEAGGMDQSFTYLAQQPYGPWLLGAVAIGLVAFGAFRFFEARYHHLLAR